MSIRELLEKLSIEELKFIKENPYLIDEIIYEKKIELLKTRREYISAVGNVDNQGKINWLDNSASQKRTM